MSQVKHLQYPEGIADIPFASFLHIERFEYKEAMETVARRQNDALGLISRTKEGLLGKVLTTVNETVDGAFNEETELSGNLVGNAFKAYGNFSKNNDKMFEATDANLAKHTKGIVTQVPGEKNPRSVEQLAADKEFRKSLRLKGLSASSCMLPMPNEYQYQYTADWNNQFKLGTLALLAENAGKAIGISLISGFANIVPDLIANTMARSKGFNKSADEIKGKDFNKSGGSEMFQNAKKGFYNGFDAFKVNSPIGIGNLKNVVSLAGLAPNENAIQMFQRMDMREFEFTFEFAARDAKESIRIESIIEWFKRGMHPTTKNGKGSAVLLTFPDVWLITPKFVEAKQNEKNPDLIEVGSTIQHPSLPKTKLCALTGLQVNTTPMGSFNTVFDGSIPLMQVTVKFKELTALTRMDMELANQSTNHYDPDLAGEDKTVYLGKYNDDGELLVPASGWRRSEELKNFPRLTY